MGLASGVGCVLLPPCYQRLCPLFLDRNRQVLVGEFRQFIIGDDMRRFTSTYTRKKIICLILKFIFVMGTESDVNDYQVKTSEE